MSRVIATGVFLFSSLFAHGQQVLFAVHAGKGDVSAIEPIGFFDESLRFTNVPDQCKDEPRSLEFYHHYLEGNARYNLYSNGAFVAKGVVPQKQEPDPAVISVSSPLVNGGLATDKQIETKTPRPVSSLNEADQIKLKRLAASLLSARKVAYKPSELRTAQVWKVVDDDHGTTSFVGAYEVVRTEDSLPVSKAAVFLIATPRGNGMRPSYTWFHRPITIDDSRMVTLFSQLDLNSDGKDELVLQLDFYENRRFLVLTRSAFGFKKVFETQTIGCL